MINSLNNELLLTIKSIPWFHDLPVEKINRLSEVAFYCDVPMNKYIFEEGARSSELYIILEGQILLENYVPTKGKKALYYANPLDIIGWSSMTPVVRQRANSAKAITNCHLLVFNANDLLALCDKDPELGYVVMKKLTNVIASRFLNLKLQLFDIIVNQSNKRLPVTQE